MDKLKKIMIACPIHNRAWILPYYLKHIKNIDYPKSLINLYFVVNNSKDESLEILTKFKEKNQEQYNNIKISIFNNSKIPKDSRDSNTRIKMGIYSWLSELRNNLLKECAKSNCEYLLSCDSDILVSSDILHRLLNHKKHIVSSLLYNGYKFTSIEESYKYPNILNFQSNGNIKRIVNYRIKFPEKNPIGTIIPVDITGACILISKEVCQNTQYGFHNWGEDVAWSIDCKNNGYELFCDISMLQTHVMGKEFLEKFSIKH